MLFNHLGSRKMRGCNCNLTGWGRQWKKGLKSDLPSTWQVGLRWQASPACCLPAGTWQGIKYCPVPKRNCFWLNLLPQSTAFLWTRKWQKNKKSFSLSSKAKSSPGVPERQFPSYPQSRADPEASIQLWFSQLSAPYPTVNTALHIQQSYVVTRADGSAEINTLVPSFANKVLKS